MEDNLTSDPVEKTPEQIEADMFETRESLTEKVAALENQVVGTVQNAAQTLTETVDAVKTFVTTAPEAVTETVEQVTTAVKDSVKRTLDLNSWVESYPWACVGASVGVGFLGTYLLSRNGSSEPKSRARSMPSTSSTTPLSPHPFSSSAEPGLFDGLFEVVNRKVHEKVKELTENAIDVAASALNRNLKEHLPQIVDQAASRFIPDQEGPDVRTNPFGRA